MEQRRVQVIRVVSGAGGDGGVESYAVLKDGSIIGLQAKWFPTSMASSQIAQIKNSIKTAKKVRPEISRYIVCVPRDLASKTARSENSEDTRWENMITSVVADYPDLAVELWNESRIVAELQKPSASGIFKFWFENAEVSDESVQYAFEKAKSSWLTTKYVPELNTYLKNPVPPTLTIEIPCFSKLIPITSANVGIRSDSASPSTIIIPLAKNRFDFVESRNRCKNK